MLLALGWPPLYPHPKCARLVLMFKLLHNLLIIFQEYLLTPSPVTTTRANHNLTFCHYQTTIDAYKFSSFPRTVTKWNNSPSHIVNEQTLNSFKQSSYQHFTL